MNTVLMPFRKLGVFTLTVNRMLRDDIITFLILFIWVRPTHPKPNPTPNPNANPNPNALPLILFMWVCLNSSPSALVSPPAPSP